MYKAALAGGATLFVTGEMRHHDALAAGEAGLAVICLGHSNSERIALTKLSRRLVELTAKTSPLKVLISKSDRDPYQIV